METYGLVDLREIRNKSEINSLKIISSAIGQLLTDTFNGFENIINLDLSFCHIRKLEQSVFDSLIHLKLINLSDNIIVSIDTGLFHNNSKLESIILKNNLLTLIKGNRFSNLELLDSLDLSYNFFLLLDACFLKCQNLKELLLNNNEINNIDLTAFNELTNLNCLSLNNNQIEKIDENTFKLLKNLRYLNLNDNRISVMDHHCFWQLENLKELYLANNLLTFIITKYLFIYLTNLVELDMSNNDNCSILNNTFDRCRNLKSLKLMITERFDSASIKRLTALREFELIFKQKNFSLTSSYWFNYKNLTSLKVLKLIFQKLESIILCDFTPFKNMEYLHIECLEPNDVSRDFNLPKMLLQMPKLNKLVLKKLNGFSVTKFGYECESLTHLNLAGLKNHILVYVFWTYSFIEYLDLSFSEVEVIVEDTFKCLTNLEHLEFAYSKLKAIDSVSFKYNSKLQILNCNHCCIETIQDYSFLSQQNLLLLDLTDNKLQTTTENMFYGLDMETCIIIL